MLSHNKSNNPFTLTLLSAAIILFSSTTTHAIPPQPPVKCATTSSTNCTLSNAYGVWGDRKPCQAPSVFYPTNESQLIHAVAYAAQNNLTVKTVTKFSHTIPKLSCPHSTNSILISTANYDTGIEIDVENRVVTVDSGVGLRDLINKVEEVGLSLVATPYWEGVSIGGLISTGSHGSSWWGNGGAVHDHVVGIRLIVPQGSGAKVISLEKGNPLLDAAKVSLGVLGVISKIKLSLEPAFKRSITYNFTKDDNIEEEFINHAKNNEFGDITWYPSKHTAVYRYDNRVPLNTNGDGVNDFIGFQPQSVLITKSIRAAEKEIEKNKSIKAKCVMASTVVESKKLTANGLKNNKLLFTGYPVIGPQSKMQTSGSCLYSPQYRIDTSCAWDPRNDGLFFYESTAIFPSSKFSSFLSDVKKLRDLNPDNFCNIDIYNGILIRFIKFSDAYLGSPEDSVVIDFNYYRADDAMTPRLKQDILEEVEQMAFFKYGARPHWAKNRNLVFRDGVEKKYPRFGKFVDAKKELDPTGMFSSEWSDEVLFGKVGGGGDWKFDGCALEGLCVCSEDKHCSPSKGYYCKPGLVYQDARVCRYTGATTTSSLTTQ